MTKLCDYKNFYSARNKAIIAMLFEFGIRNLDLCNLRVNAVRNPVIKVLGKGNKERYVPIDSALKKVLIKYERIRSEYIRYKLITENIKLNDDSVSHQIYNDYNSFLSLIVKFYDIFLVLCQYFGHKKSNFFYAALLAINSH